MQLSTYIRQDIHHENDQTEVGFLVQDQGSLRRKLIMNEIKDKRGSFSCITMFWKLNNICDCKLYTVNLRVYVICTLYMFSV